MSDLVEKFKGHIHFEEGMDDSMLSFYLDNATKYVKRVTDKDSQYLILMVASIMYEFRLSEAKLAAALNALTPFLITEVISNE